MLELWSSQRSICCPQASSCSANAQKLHPWHAGVGQVHSCNACADQTNFLFFHGTRSSYLVHYIYGAIDPFPLHLKSIISIQLQACTALKASQNPTAAAATARLLLPKLGITMVVPVIDFSKLEGAERAETLAQIANGCEEWGFFQLVNHGIPLELLERVKKVSSECYRLREAGFRSSEPVRTLEALVDAERRGEAVAPVDDMDWEDIFYIDDACQWPSDPPAFKETMREYRAELRKLAERVMEAMDENLGLARGAIKAAFSGDGRHEPFFGTKVSHYPPCPRPDLVTGLRAHTDAGGVILLFQDDRVGGLEVLKDGRWTDVQPLAGAIVVNTGDQIEVLSNGRYRSAWHRVLPMRDGNRRSIASFYNPANQATISPAVAAAGGGEEAYPKYVFGDYMDVYAKQKFQAKEPRFQAVKPAAPNSSPAA